MGLFKSAVRRAVEEYNRYRSPEAVASIVEIGKDQLVMDFGGSFCRGCGVSDYLEDFIYELKRHVKVEMAVSSFEQVEPEKFRVKYTLVTEGELK